jgi:hypothetical protein
VYLNVKIMEPTNEKQNRRTDPSNVNQNPGHRQAPKQVEDDDKSETNVDLDKGNFADRRHGRTHDSLGPDHEPGTV